MRRIFERTEEWRKLHNEALYALHYSSNVIQVIKSIIMRWEGNVARMGDRRRACSVSRGDPIEFTWKTKARMGG
jgi:hypothetical protein